MLGKFSCPTSLLHGVREATGIQFGTWTVWAVRATVQIAAVGKMREIIGKSLHLLPCFDSLRLSRKSRLTRHVA